MIQVSLENKDAADNAGYRLRYKEVYVQTKDFGNAGRLAMALVGGAYVISSMSEVEAEVLAEDGSPL